MIAEKKHSKFYSYSEYLKLSISCAENKITTGTEMSESRIQATMLNTYRMLRIYKQITLQEKLVKLLKGNKNINWDWLVISEAWCGDSAQCLPLIFKISELNNGIKLRIVLRDEDEELINKYRTNGSKAIPKLICTDSFTGREIGTWGPRPTEIASMVTAFKSNNPLVSHDDFVKQLHLWYAKDKGLSLQADFYSLICNWTNKF